MKALKFAILSIVVFFITNNAFAQINLTTYKGGDKELIRHIEKNIKHPETEFIEGGLSIVFAKIIFNRQGFIDSFKISVNNNNPFGKSILLALNKSKENWSKFLCDYFPLIIFIIVYKFSTAPDPLLPATLCLLVSSFVALIIAYILTKKIAKMPLISAIILGIFGGLTLISGDDLFIKN